MRRARRFAAAQQAALASDKRVRRGQCRHPHHGRYLRRISPTSTCWYQATSVPCSRCGKYQLRKAGLAPTLELWRKVVPARSKLSPLATALYAVNGVVPRFMHVWPYRTHRRPHAHSRRRSEAGPMAAAWGGSRTSKRCRVKSSCRRHFRPYTEHENHRLSRPSAHAGCQQPDLLDEPRAARRIQIASSASRPRLRPRRRRCRSCSRRWTR